MAVRARVTLSPEGGQSRDIGKIDVLNLGHGDVLRMVTPSGGGFGDPFTRDAAAVVAEVVEGLLDPVAARTQYGVAVEGGVLDEAATATLRAAPRRAGEMFALGPVRLEQDRIWPPAARAALAQAAIAAPDGVRPHRLAALRTELAALDRPVTVDDVALAAAE